MPLKYTNQQLHGYEIRSLRRSKSLPVSRPELFVECQRMNEILRQFGLFDQRHPVNLPESRLEFYEELKSLCAILHGMRTGSLKQTHSPSFYQSVHEALLGTSSALFDESPQKQILSPDVEPKPRPQKWWDALPAPPQSSHSSPFDGLPTQGIPIDEHRLGEPLVEESLAEEPPNREIPVKDFPTPIEDFQDDEPADDEPADDEPADDEPADDEPADDEPADDEPADDESPEDEPLDNESADDKSPEDELPKDEPPEDESPEDESADDEETPDDEPLDEEPRVEVIQTKALLDSGEQLVIYVKHLHEWTYDHETSPQFHGKIGVLAAHPLNKTFLLGEYVRCVLLYADHPTLRKRVIVRLFARRRQKPGLRFSLVFRCGGGFMKAADFLNKEHIVLLRATNQLKWWQKTWVQHPVPDVLRQVGPMHEKGQWRASVPIPENKNTVIIHPMFPALLDLPQELQDLVWITATGLEVGIYRPSRHHATDYPIPHIQEDWYPKPDAPINHSILLRLSRSINRHMAPWVYRTLDFRFELTGFTNFLWLSGPMNRSNIRRVHFKFTSMALLHCMRWLAPNLVFDLFEPPAYTSPPGLQFFWRLQIQELSRDLHLRMLTFDMENVQDDHMPLIWRCMQQIFGSVKEWKFVNSGVMLAKEDPRLKCTQPPKQTWRELCRWFFIAHQQSPGYMTDTRRAGTIEELERDMDAHHHFFDSVADGAEFRLRTMGKVRLP